MRMTINVKTGRIYLPREVVDFLGTDRIEITSDDNYFSINERMGADDDGIRINKDNVINNRAVVQWLVGQYDFEEEKIVLEISDLRMEGRFPVVYVETGLPCTNRDE